MWIVENGAVRLAPVQVGGTSGNDVVLVAGVKPGQTIVTAGVNVLKNGQKVSILQEAPAAGTAAPAPVATAAAAPRAPAEGAK